MCKNWDYNFQMNASEQRFGLEFPIHTGLSSGKPKREKRKEKNSWFQRSVETFCHHNLAEKKEPILTAKCLSNVGTLFSEIFNPILQCTYGYGLCSNLQILLD